mmetsp:Transcript_6461/g.11557  ORF Transcript_6461/g.11557 Transcript_6461/m.11557 type:complete len:424 (-) Transcript_6461:514-1785(-)
MGADTRHGIFGEVVVRVVGLVPRGADHLPEGDAEGPGVRPLRGRQQMQREVHHDHRGPVSGLNHRRRLSVGAADHCQNADRLVPHLQLLLGEVRLHFEWQFGGGLAVIEGGSIPVGVEQDGIREAVLFGLDGQLLLVGDRPLHASDLVFQLVKVGGGRVAGGQVFVADALAEEGHLAVLEEGRHPLDLPVARLEPDRGLHGGDDGGRGVRDVQEGARGAEDDVAVLEQWNAVIPGEDEEPQGFRRRGLAQRVDDPSLHIDHLQAVPALGHVERHRRLAGRQAQLQALVFLLHIQLKVRHRHAGQPVDLWFVEQLVAEEGQAEGAMRVGGGQVDAPAAMVIAQCWIGPHFQQCHYSTRHLFHLFALGLITGGANQVGHVTAHVQCSATITVPCIDVNGTILHGVHENPEMLVPLCPRSVNASES